MNLALCVLGEKGHAVLTSLVDELGREAINSVFIGRDLFVTDDFFEQNKMFCEAQGIRHLVGNKFSSNEHPYDYVLAAGWRWMIQGISDHKLIVFHDSLLPKYRGFAPLVNSLLNREERIGVTALFGAHEYDRGDIIAQESLPVEYPTTIQKEISRISQLYSILARKIAKSLGHLEGTPQDEYEASYSLWRDNNDYRVDWKRSASDIEHFVSCIGSPYLGASSEANGSMVRIFGAEVLEDVRIENRAPGKIIFIKGGMPVVVCGRGLLKITEIKDEGGASLLPWKRMKTRFD